MRFAWDAEKNERNIAKHGVAFEYAVLIFSGRVAVRVDDRRDYGEPRWIGLGAVDGRVFCVVWTTRSSEVYRIISARKAHERETKAYHS